MAASTDTSGGGALPELTNRTPFLGLKLYVLILVFLVIVLAFVIMILVCVRRSRSSKKRKMRVEHSSGTIPLVSKEIVEVNALDLADLKMAGVVDVDPKKQKHVESKIEVEITEGRRMSEESGVSVESPNIGWGRWYSLKELEVATDGFAEANMIGEGGYGIVYRGALHDGSVVAVKNLLNNKYVFVCFHF